MHVSAWNVALQIVNFLVLAWLLERFVFQPVRKVLDKRREAVEVSLGRAEASKAEAERAANEYREKASAIASAADEARQRALALAEREAQQLREEASRKAQAEVEIAKRTVEQERAEALRVLEARAADLAAAMAQRLLQDVRPESDVPFLWKATATIDALEPGAKAALGREVATGTVEIVSSRPLDPATRERLEKWLSDLAGARVHPSYRVDDALIAGVELHLPTGVLRSHFRASLDRVREELGAHAAAP
jgi:F-type H+-transporting ATPase subunit b